MPQWDESSNTTITDLASSGCEIPVCTQILTINLEDYFQAGVFHRYISPRNWYRFESRLQKNTEDTLQLLSDHKTHATFFVLGWIADKYPELVRQISAAGHEIASRGFIHQPLLKLSPEARQEDLIRSKETLEDTIGQEVRGFRLSDGWLTRRDLGFLDELIQAGYEYDSSLMPRHREFLAQPWRRLIHVHKSASGHIMEIPPTTMSVAGAWMPVAGGNYVRQFPARMMNAVIERCQKNELAPFVMYFQVWELDEQQPRLNVISRLATLRHYRNLGKYRQLLPRFLKAARFTSIAEHSRLPSSPLAELSRDGVSDTTKKTIRRDRQRGPSAVSPYVSDPRQRSYRRPAVTLVIPCYNEEASLPYLHRTMQSLRHELTRTWDLKLLFVDDCSKDNTREVLTALFGNDPDVRIVSHYSNRGVSAGILTGIRASDTDVVASIDADCSYDPHELVRMLQLLSNDVAMVTASPYHPEGRVCNVPRWRLLLSHTLSRFYRRLLGRSLSTWTSCFRVYRKHQIVDLDLKETGFLGTAELAAQLCLHGRRIVEHPATLEVRLFGFSKMKTVRTILAHLRLLTSVAAQKWRGSNGEENRS
jgi:polysaccharide deacetylase family protein (PEP-CTERM system associated)